jgi:type IV pilus assembly protein PilO
MTNLQAELPSGAFLTRERVLFAAPLVLGGLLALAVLGIGVLPALQQVGRDQQKLNDLNQQEATLPLLRNQLLAQQTNEAEALGLRAKLLSLIAGSGEINTFLAQLSAEGLSTGVQLDAYEPLGKVAPAAATPAPGAKGAPPAPSDQCPLIVPGFECSSWLVSARGSYTQLLAFLRRLESLGLLVVQSDLGLTLEDTNPQEAATAGSTAPPVQPIPRSILKLKVTLYSRFAK